ncbi:hypothetical protein [Natrinema gari]|uniref:Uncharacterized protein n=1 Tax=Natrinema gari JCM 14663 TaxID=1230459 RepID=L9ZJC4_9EURY|nr:hypothetical protein [Natrinema gari]ELY85268.1 hypothetical protein C486_00210 [Natrinema gari JCM 14663]
MTGPEPAPEHVGLRGDPPVIADLEKLRGIPSIHLGNAVYVQAVERRPDGTYAAYLGFSKPRDTSDGASRNEITFVNYGPVGAMYAHPVEIGGETYYEVDLPDRDELEAACIARREREGDHRAAVVPPLANLLEEGADEHADRSGDLHRGMALAFEAARRELVARRDAAYRGDRRWSRDELDEGIDLE